MESIHFLKNSNYFLASLSTGAVVVFDFESNIKYALPGNSISSTEERKVHYVAKDESWFLSGVFVSAEGNEFIERRDMEDGKLIAIQRQY